VRRLSIAVLTGLFATFVMDGLNHLLAATGVIDPIHHAIIGRILAAWLQGDFAFASPGHVPQLAHAELVGYVFHYAIGAALTAFYLLVLARDQRPRLLGAVVFGVVTSAFSLLLLFPSAGIGLLGLDAPTLRPLTTSLVNHACFGLGTYLGQRFR
jgi:hypothetical protein